MGWFGGGQAARIAAAGNKARLAARAAGVTGPARRKIVQEAKLSEAMANRGVRSKLSSFRDNIYSTGWAFDTLTNFGDKLLPRVTKGVTVKICGNQFSSISELFYLAVSIASSRMRKGPGGLFSVGAPWEGAKHENFVATIDYTRRFVQVDLAYSIGAVIGLVGRDSALNDIKSPPAENITALNLWPKFMNSGPGKEVIVKDALIVEPVLTKAPGINPYPATDGISRTSDLHALVSAGLMPACVTPYVRKIPEYDVTYKPKVDGLPKTIDTLKLPNSQRVKQ